MRITQSEMSRSLLSDIGMLNEDISTLSRQISSGKKLTELKDSPSGSAELISLTRLDSEIDQYRFNTDAGTFYLNVADSALNEVNNLITSIYANGSQASSDGINDDSRAALAGEVRSLREQVFSMANSQVRGRYIFAGSMVASVPFEMSGDSVVYRGDSIVNRVQIDDGTEVQTSFSGTEVFDPVFTAIDSLLAGMDSNDVSSITTALDQFSAVLSGLSQVRGQIGTGMSTLRNTESRLESRETSLKEQRSRIEDTDMAQAVVQLKQSQTGLEAAMSAGGSALTQRNLFDFLG